MDGDEESEPHDLVAPLLHDEERQAADDQHECGNGHGGYDAAPEDERSRGQVDTGGDHGHEAPRRRDSGDGEIPSIQLHMRSGASTPMRSRLRATTLFVASESESLKGSASLSSTRW